MRTFVHDASGPWAALSVVATARMNHSRHVQCYSCYGREVKVEVRFGLVAGGLRWYARPMRYMQWIGALFLLGMLPACSSVEEDLCDAKCECQGCNENDYRNCLNDHDEDLRAADYRGCLDLYDAWIDCQDATAVCRGADWDTSCGHEHERLKNCTKD